MGALKHNPAAIAVVQRMALRFMAESIADSEDRKPSKQVFRPFPPSSPLNFPRNPRMLRMQTNLSARSTCRERTGWRREEWAHSPLFICGKFTGVNTPKTAV
jgi:hypothetical protein